MSCKENYRDFQRDIEARGIKNLIHFTPTLNLFSILEQRKIMSRAMLESLDIYQYDILDYVQFTDDYRFDDKRYINLSISCPNTYLLDKFISKTKSDMTIHWCILMIDPQHIYDTDTMFSVTNAASSAANNQFGISGDLEAFRKMFDEKICISSNRGARVFSRNGLANQYPTDVQAEVLVRDTIPASSINYVCFQSEEDMAQAKAAMMGMRTDNFVVDSAAFYPDRRV